MSLVQWHIVICLVASVSTGAVQITGANLDSLLASHELVFLNFYASWCRFSQILNPIYDQFADKVQNEFPQTGLVAIGKIDCDHETSIAAKYHVNKYPTLKFARHGLIAKREYRGARQLDALMNFLRDQIRSAIVNVSSPTELERNKAFVIGQFNSAHAENYQTFVKVANLLRDDCRFAVSINSDTSHNESVHYRPAHSSGDRDELYSGSIDNQASFYAWTHDRCLPLVREITFENAEELTDEGLPFLLLFHHADDHHSVTLFEHQVSKQLRHEMVTMNCLHADGAKFAHPLKHLGKTTADLPVLIIDSFQHMFLFPDFQSIATDGKLLQFVKDFHSGKVHKEFHQPATTSKTVQSNRSSPPESIFIHLSPSRQRYSFRDEL